jgi:hypothetical protein
MINETPVLGPYLGGVTTTRSGRGKEERSDLYQRDVYTSSSGMCEVIPRISESIPKLCLPSIVEQRTTIQSVSKGQRKPEA